MHGFDPISKFLIHRNYVILLHVSLLTLFSTSVSGQCSLSGSGLPPHLAGRVGKYFPANYPPEFPRYFNEEGTMLYQIFGINPNMLVLNDSPPLSPNAYAMPNYTLPGYTGTVLFGITLIAEQWNTYGGHAMAGIMAHEFAHVLQYHRNIPPDIPTKHVELHADFLAGYYLARRKSVSPVYLEQFSRSLFALGDYEYNSEDHHGTPDERVAAMLAGFEAWTHNTIDLNKAYFGGLNFVRERFPLASEHSTGKTPLSNTEADPFDDSGITQDNIDSLRQDIQEGQQLLATRYAEAITNIARQAPNGFKRFRGELKEIEDGVRIYDAVENFPADADDTYISVEPDSAAFISLIALGEARSDVMKVYQRKLETITLAARMQGWKTLETDESVDTIQFRIDPKAEVILTIGIAKTSDDQLAAFLRIE